MHEMRLFTIISQYVLVIFSQNAVLYSHGRFLITFLDLHIVIGQEYKTFPSEATVTLMWEACDRRDG